MLDIIVRVALATVLVVSGTAKLSSRGSTRAAVAGFGVPARLVGVVALALAPAELLVAALIVPGVTATVGLLAALALLSAFTLAVVLALRAGRRPDCQCFGRIGAADVSARTVARNLLLVGLAAAGLAHDERGEPTASAVVAGLLLAGLVIGAEGLAGRAARLRRESSAATAYDSAHPAPAPPFRLPTLAGGRMTLDDLLAPGLPVLLVTLSPGCGPCRALRPDIARWAEILHARVTVAVLATGDRESNAAAYADLPHLPVLLDELGVREELGTAGAPSAVVIGPDGLVAGPVAVGEHPVRRLLASTLAGAAVGEVGDDPAAPGGTPADDLDLSSVVRPRPGIETYTPGESTVLLDPATGATVALDPIGALVWSVLDGTSTLAEVVDDLADAFGASPDTVGADVLAMVKALGLSGLLDGVAAGSTRPDQVPVA